MEVKDFLKWYAETYNCGDINEQNYLECLKYLQGFIAGRNKKDSELERCLNVLRGGYNLLVAAKNK